MIAIWVLFYDGIKNGYITASLKKRAENPLFSSWNEIQATSFKHFAYYMYCCLLCNWSIWYVLLIQSLSV